MEEEEHDEEEEEEENEAEEDDETRTRRRNRACVVACLLLVRWCLFSLSQHDATYAIARIGPMSGDTSIDATTVTLLSVISPTVAMREPTTVIIM